MKYGVLFPQTEIGNDPAAIRDFAQMVEQLGFDYLMTYEHVLGADPNRPEWEGYRPYDYTSAFHEPFVLFSHLSAFTTTLEFATGILVLPQRQTPLVAKQAAEVDLLSGGRLRLGVGIGWNEVEFGGMGVDFKTRAKRIEEQVHVMRQLWSNELVSYEGDFHWLDQVGINPLPKCPIPIWMGGIADPVLRRMAKMADGWFMYDAPVEKLQTYIDTLHGYLKAEGRSPDSFGLDIRLNMQQIPESDWPKWIEQRKQLGITHMAIVPVDVASAPESLKRFRQLAESV